MTNHKDLNEFARAYVEAIFFTDAGPDAEEELQDKSFEDFAPKTVEKLIAECAAFERDNKELLDQAGDSAQNGHDFWLTRNHHGVGYWDRDYPKAIGEALTEEAHDYGESFLYAGDDGKLYLG